MAGQPPASVYGTAGRVLHPYLLTYHLPVLSTHQLPLFLIDLEAILSVCFLLPFSCRPHTRTIKLVHRERERERLSDTRCAPPLCHLDCTSSGDSRTKRGRALRSPGPAYCASTSHASHTTVVLRSTMLLWGVWPVGPYLGRISWAVQIDSTVGRRCVLGHCDTSVSPPCGTGSHIRVVPDAGVVATASQPPRARMHRHADTDTTLLSRTHARTRCFIMMDTATGHRSKASRRLERKAIRTAVQLRWHRVDRLSRG
jgi:hypothetical protein